MTTIEIFALIVATVFCAMAICAWVAKLNLDDELDTVTKARDKAQLQASSYRARLDRATVALDGLRDQIRDLLQTGVYFSAALEGREVPS